MRVRGEDVKGEGGSVCGLREYCHIPRTLPPPHSQDLTVTLKRDHEAVNKDNNFIYNDLVPDFGTLEPPGKAILAKPVQLSSPAPNFVDLFSSLMPLSVNQAIGAYDGKRETLVNGELDKLREATHALNEYVVSHSCTPSLHTLPSHPHFTPFTHVM